MNKVVMITGAATGIGKETATLFAKNGFDVAGTYFKSLTQAQELNESLKGQGHKTQFYSLDIRNEADCVNVTERIIKDFGKIDVLINNAGVSQSKLFTEITKADLDDMMTTNFSGAFFVTRTVVKDMLKRQNGKIINISSIWGKHGGSMEVHYSASKAALDGLTKALAKELGTSGITVNSVNCGLINTRMNEELSENDKKAFTSTLPLQRIGNASEVASTVLWLASDDCSYLTGQLISIDGGFSI